MTRSPLRIPYCLCLCTLACAWLIGAVACYALSSMLGPNGAVEMDWQRLMTIVCLGSGAVALLAGLPGALGELTQSGEIKPGQVTVGFSAGSLIRLFGTVALVGFCRYQMPAAKLEAVGLILAWYVYLTTVDVFVLSKLLPRTDRKRFDGSDSPHCNLGQSDLPESSETPNESNLFTSKASTLAPSAIPR